MPFSANDVTRLTRKLNQISKFIHIQQNMIDSFRGFLNRKIYLDNRQVSVSLITLLTKLNVQKNHLKKKTKKEKKIDNKKMFSHFSSSNSLILFIINFFCSKKFDFFFVQIYILEITVYLDPHRLKQC